MDPRDRLIVALDYPTQAQAMAMVDQLEGSVQWFKVGLELYLAAGRPVVEALRLRGYSVFLDLKLHDIPNTVAGAVRTAAAAGASLLTLHAAGGPAMLQRAVEAAAALSQAPRLLAVTVLTSMDRAQLTAIGVEGKPAAQVLRLGEMAMASAISGLVCSPEEIEALRCGGAASAMLVVPGIRPEGAATNDQVRIATPAAAIRSGADMLVVGRPITQAAQPAVTAVKILQEIASAR